MTSRKVIIHTINDDTNFGNRLQNYALQKILSEQFLLEVETKQDTTGLNYYNALNDLKNVWGIRHVLAFYQGRNNNYFRAISWRNRNRIFRGFTKLYVPKSKTQRVTMDALHIVGSDQIWNPEFRQNIQEDFLPGVDSKISYAASIGMNPQNIEEYDSQIFKQELPKFRSLSVRENDAAEAIKKWGIENVEVVLDPTLLLPQTAWLKLAKESKFKVNGKFILTYFLGEISEKLNRELEEYASLHNLQIIRINDEKQSYFGSIGPLEFIYLFNKTERVFTDSYHAVVFSVINHKNFDVFTRVDAKVKHNMNSRMETMMKRLELNTNVRQMDQGLSDGTVDYNLVSKKLEEARVKSLMWLKEAINSADS